MVATDPAQSLLALVVRRLPQYNAATMWLMKILYSDRVVDLRLQEVMDMEGGLMAEEKLVMSLYLSSHMISDGAFFKAYNNRS